jgi:hypothetical protein
MTANRCVRNSAFLVLLLASLSAVGCGNTQAARPAEFGPAELRIHPTFTSVKKLDNSSTPNAIEAVVELVDSFGEPTRGSGTFLFELWSFRNYDPDPLGNRVAGPWRGVVVTREEQQAHWNPALRAYTFPLSYPTVNPTKQYVLTASFETAGGADKPGGKRLFAKLVIQPPPEKRQPGDRVRGAGGHRP